MKLTTSLFKLIACLGLVCCSFPVLSVAYPQGTVSIKPLTMNFALMSWTLRKADSVINGSGRDAYKTMRGFGFNEDVRPGMGYSFELGITPVNDFEIFTIVGISRETGISNVEVNRAFPTAADQRFLSFKSRTNVHVSLGGRYYFEWKKNWVPFISGSLGVDFQGPVKATALVTAQGPVLGDFTIQNSKSLLKGAVLAGVDYRFDKRWAISFSTGLQYLQRETRETTTNLAGVTMRYKDGRNAWSIPFLAALKISF